MKTNAPAGPAIAVTAIGQPDPSLAFAPLFDLVMHRALGIPQPVRSEPKLRDRRTCVYRFFNAAGELLYVGVASNLASRKSSHRSASKWFGEVATTTEQWFDNRSEALAAEVAAIKKERPRHNVTSKPKSATGARHE